MELQTISEVSKQFNISTRTLRYYEQIGLIKSVKKEDFAYRTYDEETILRLKQIIILRKLRIPLKQVADILQNENVALLLDAFEQNLNEIEDEITALVTIKNVIQSFLEKLNIASNKLQLLDDESLLEIVDSLTVSKINFKEDKTMEDLSKASEKLNKLTDKNVRIIYLPPMTVASIHVVDESGDGAPETESGNILFDFIKTTNLSKVFPEFRHFGFNNPHEPYSGKGHGYERWLSIPNDITLPAPFVKKQISGGLYAAHMIPIGAFEEWNWLYEWANSHERYEVAWGNPEQSYGFLEEHLNAINHYLWTPDECDQRLQLDLLIPIKERVR